MGKNIAYWKGKKELTFLSIPGRTSKGTTAPAKKSIVKPKALENNLISVTQKAKVAIITLIIKLSIKAKTIEKIKRKKESREGSLKKEGKNKIKATIKVTLITISKNLSAKNKENQYLR